MIKLKLEKFFRVLGVAFITINIFVFPVAVSSSVFAEGQITPVSVDCDPRQDDPAAEDFCGDPPSIRELEFLAVRVLYAVWACGGIIFIMLLTYIGFIWMTSGGSDEKIAEAKKRAGQWVIGFLLFFLAQPLVATLMRGLIADDSECFTQLQDPGFTIFFTDVCTGGDVASNGDGGDPTGEPTITALPTDAPRPTPGAACQQEHIAACNDDACTSDSQAGSSVSTTVGADQVTCYCMGANDGVCMSVLQDGVSPLCTTAHDSQCQATCADVDVDINVPVFEDGEMVLLCGCDGSGSGACVNVFPGGEEPPATISCVNYDIQVQVAGGESSLFSLSSCSFACDNEANNNSSIRRSLLNGETVTFSASIERDLSADATYTVNCNCESAGDISEIASECINVIPPD